MARIEMALALRPHCQGERSPPLITASGVLKINSAGYRGEALCIPAGDGVLYLFNLPRGDTHGLLFWRRIKQH